MTTGRRHGQGASLSTLYSQSIAAHFVSEELALQSRKAFNLNAHAAHGDRDLIPRSQVRVRGGTRICTNWNEPEHGDAGHIGDGREEIRDTRDGDAPDSCM